MKPWHIATLGLGVVVVVAVGARAQRTLSVDELPTPSRPAPSIIQVLPPTVPPAEAILAEVKRACRLCKQPGMTVHRMAAELGDITKDDPQWSASFRPTSPYFTQGQLGRGLDDENHRTEKPGVLTLSLKNSADLPLSALEATFGKAIKDHNLHDPTPYFSWDWKEEETDPRLCYVTSNMDWRVGANQADPVMMSLGLECDDGSE